MAAVKNPIDQIAAGPRRVDAAMIGLTTGANKALKLNIVTAKRAMPLSAASQTLLFGFKIYAGTVRQATRTLGHTLKAWIGAVLQRDTLAVLCFAFCTSKFFTNTPRQTTGPYLIATAWVSLVLMYEESSIQIHQPLASRTDNPLPILKRLGLRFRLNRREWSCWLLGH
jgi:hypothetical protein